MSLKFMVHGTPRPKGSMRAVARGVMKNMSDHTRPWQHAIAAAAAQARQEYAQPHNIMTDGVMVVLAFFFVRPKGHYGTGRNENTLRPSAPRLHRHQPDIDKLIRCALDGMTGVLYHDDAQVSNVVGLKMWAEPGDSSRLEVCVNYLSEAEDGRHGEQHEIASDR